MLKMTTVVAIVLSLTLAANPVAAQCTLGVYADAAGTEGLVSPVVGETFDVYVVMFLEGLANAVGYTLVGNNLSDFVFLAATYGDGGGGVNFPNSQSDPYFGGSNVGLGECAIGFNGFPLVVAKYTVLALSATAGVEASLTVTGNAQSSGLDPAFPVYADCNGVEASCGIGPSLAIETPVSGDSESFGAVKSLFN